MFGCVLLSAVFTSLDKQPQVHRGLRSYEGVWSRLKISTIHGLPRTVENRTSAHDSTPFTASICQNKQRHHQLLCDDHERPPARRVFQLHTFQYFPGHATRETELNSHHVSDKAASALADDVILMRKTAEGLQLLLDNCNEWSAEYQMTWNTTPGKSEVLLPPRGHQTSTFFLPGETLRNVESFVYLAVSLNISGITEEKHILRVKTAQRSLMQLSPIGIHIRGYNTNLCVMLYRVFVRSIYKYGLHLVPLSLALKLVISIFESCFFRLVLGKMASRFWSSRLPRLNLFFG